MNSRPNSLVPILVVAGAIGIQAIALITLLAWLSRAVSTKDVGLLASYLTIFSFATNLDGVRQAAVVASANAHASDSRRVAASFGWAAVTVGLGSALVSGLAGSVVFGLSTPLAAGIAIPIVCYYLASPSLALLESTHGPEWAVALQAGSITIAVAVTCMLISIGIDMPTSLWSFSVGPLVVLALLASVGVLVRPSGRTTTAWLVRARHGLASNVTVAAVGAADRAFAALLGGTGLLGLYAPLAELVHRAMAAGGLVTNLFLVAETRTAHGIERALPHGVPHVQVVTAAIAISCVAAVGAAFAADSIVTALLGRADRDASLAFQIALIPTVTSLGANWAATVLRARGHFDIYRWYLVGLVAGGATAWWTIPCFGLPGISIALVLLRLADLPLLSRASRLRLIVPS